MNIKKVYTLYKEKKLSTQGEGNGTSVLQNSLVWFGAALSIAEIITGTYFAPLGFIKGLIAIILGHIIGGALLFIMGYIGAVSKKSSMECAKNSFGKLGASFFALLNVVQLIGWTSIMIYDGALSASSIFNTARALWCVVIGALIIVWLLVGILNLSKLNIISVTALFVLTIILCKTIFSSDVTKVITTTSISFGVALELSITMPLSWLPLISDYTSKAQKPFAGTFSSALTYSLVSIWMYVIGLGAQIITGANNIVDIMIKSGLGIVALVVIILSTVTTTFLDALSAGISTVTIFSRVNEKFIAISVTLLGMFFAIIFPMDNITDFLYFIGSVFAPMISILIADFFVNKNNFSTQKISISRMSVWAVGFVLYRILMCLDIPIGNTIPDILLTFALCVIVEKFIRHIHSK